MPSPTPTGGRRRTVRRVLVLSALADVVLSPAGQAAVEGVRGLVGEVGGQSTLAPPKPGNPTDPIVIHTGRGPHEERFEWVAYHADDLTPAQGSPMFCVGLDWPGVDIEERTSFGCEGRRSEAERRAPSSGFSGIGFEQLPSGAPRRDHDIVLFGRTREDVFGVRAWLTDAHGVEHELPVDFKRIEGDLLERVGGYHPFGVLVAVIDGRIAPPVSELKSLGVRPNQMPDDVTWPPGYPERCKQPPPPGPVKFALVRTGGRHEEISTMGSRSAPPGC